MLLTLLLRLHGEIARDQHLEPTVPPDRAAGLRRFALFQALLAHRLAAAPADTVRRLEQVMVGCALEQPVAPVEVWVARAAAVLVEPA
jgi:hypothetical protein